MATAVERLELLITSTGAAAAKEIASVGTAAEGAAAKQTLLQRATSSAGSAMHNLSGGIIPVEAGLKTAALAGGALAAVGLAKFAIDSANQFVNLATEVRKFRDISGTSSETASKMVAVLDDWEISTQKGATAMFRLGREVDSGGKNLAAYGIEIAKNKDGTADLEGTLLNIADAYKNTADPAERAAIAQAAFGKAGKDLVPLLKEGAAGLKEFMDQAERSNPIFTDADIANAERLRLAIDELGDAWKKFQVQVGQLAAPILTTIATETTKGLNAFDQALQATGTSASDASHAVGVVLTNVSGLGAVTHSAAAATELLNGNFGDAAEEFARGVPVLGSVIGLIDDGSDSSNKFADAQERQKSAAQDVARLYAEGKTGTDEYKKATDELASSTRVVEGAQRDVATAIQNAANQSVIARDAFIQQAAAGLALAGSDLAIRNALAQREEKQAAVDEAQRKLNDATARASELNGENELANYAVSLAARDLEAAQRDLEGANYATQASVLQYIGAAVAKSNADLQGASDADRHKAAIDAQNQAIIDLWNSTPGARQALEDLGFTVRNLPDGKQIVITADVSNAIAGVSDVANRVAGLADKTVNIVTHFLTASKGGFVPGVGNSDSVPTLLTPGEFVVSKDMMRNAKLHGRSPAGLSMGGGEGGPVHIENVVVLDGEVVARNTAKYMNRAGGPRLSRRALTN